MFTAAKITQLLTKFHWALAKLPFLLIATVHPLSREPTAFSDSYKELQELLLQIILCAATQGPPSCGTISPPCSQPR
jgi:hypothetical protein